MAEYVVVLHTDRLPDGQWTYPKIEVCGPDLQAADHDLVTELYAEAGLMLQQIAKRRNPRLGRPAARRGLSVVATAVTADHRPVWAQLELGLSLRESDEP